MKTSDLYTEGSVFLTAPLRSTLALDGTLGGDYLFIEPYASLGEQGEQASSLGFGWRHLFNQQSLDKLQSSGPARFLDEGWYVGANLFVDRLHTQYDNDFWQMGFGLEVGSRYLELRGNYYLPLDDQKKLATRHIEEQTFTTTSTQTIGTVGAVGAPFAQGNGIYQNTGSNVSEVTTTDTTTVRRTTSIFEEGMAGWDAEAALLVPYIDRWCDLKILGGYFSFDNQPFGPQNGSTGNVQGWKAGVELRPVPAIALSALWYEDERFTGSDWTVGVRFEIPLGKEWKDAFKSRRRHLIERMAEPVHRQNAAVKVGNSKRVAEKAETARAVTRRVVQQGAGVITIKEDVVFVNNGADEGNGIAQAGTTESGTAEQPFVTVQGGATEAGNQSTATGRVWTAYIQGTSLSPYAESVNVSTGSVNFVASGPNGGFAGVGGQVFGGNSGTATVSGGIFADDVNTFGVRGFNMNTGHSSSGDILRAENVRNVNITDNTFTNAADDAIFVGGETPSVVLVANNRATTLGDDFVDAQFESGDQAKLTLRNNTASGIVDSALDIYAAGAGGILINATGNTFGSVGGVAFYGTTIGTSSLDGTFTGNTVDGAKGGFDLQLDGTGSNSINISHNVLTNVTGNNISLSLFTSARVTAVIDDNELMGTFGTATGITFTTVGSSRLTALVTNNAISTALTGISATSFNPMGIALDVSGNSIGSVTTGFAFSTMDAGSVTVSASAAATNTVTNESGNKLTASGFPTGTIKINNTSVPAGTTLP